MRQLTKRATKPVEALLNQLLSATSPEFYRDIMYKLGLQIGQDIASLYGNPSIEVHIVCTVEDETTWQRALLISWKASRPSELYG